MSAITIQQMADRVAGLLEQKLGIGDKGLAAKILKSGRRLPKPVRGAAEAIAKAADMAQNARLLHQIDVAQVAEAYDICLKHLSGIDVADRRMKAALNIAASLAFNLLTAAGVVWVLLWWRQLI